MSALTVKSTTVHETFAERGQRLARKEGFPVTLRESLADMGHMAKLWLWRSVG